MSDGRGSRIGDRGSDARFDAAIDHAVREMLDVDQPAGFRARVARRIEGGQSGSLVASAFRRKILLFGIPLAAAAILILAVVLPRTGQQPQQQPTNSARVEPRPEAPRVTPPPSNIETARPVTSERAPVARQGVASSRSVTQGSAPRIAETVAATSFDPGENATTQIEPLKTIAPIQVAPVDQSSIALEDITVRPLNPISELQIAPLTPPDRRN